MYSKVPVCRKLTAAHEAQASRAIGDGELEGVDGGVEENVGEGEMELVGDGVGVGVGGVLTVDDGVKVAVGDCEGGRKYTVVVIATTEVIADEPVLYV